MKLFDLVKGTIKRFDMELGWYLITLHQGGIKYDYKVTAYDIYEAQEKALLMAEKGLYIYSAEWSLVEAKYVGKAE